MGHMLSIESLAHQAYSQGSIKPTVEKRQKQREGEGTTDKINKTAPVTDVYGLCRRATDNSRNVAPTTKGGLENSEGACWAHFLCHSHVDPLLSLCLHSGSMRKVNHRHLAMGSLWFCCSPVNSQ